MNNALYSPFGLVVAALSVIAAAWLAYCFQRKGWQKRWAVSYALTAAMLSLLLGRAIYCGIHSASIFYDPMGRFMGLAPFFDPQVGTISVVGVVLGCLAAAPLTAVCMKARPLAVLDVLALPLTLLFALARFFEPLTGQGYGPAVTASWLCWEPLSIQNGWGGWMISICFIEGLLLLCIAAFLLFFKPRQTGTVFLVALLLVTASQLIPESLRRDNALKLFTFARINQICFVTLLFAGCVGGWVRSARLGQGRKVIWAEVALTLLGILLLIAGEFALDKTQWPDAAIYLVMAAILLSMLGAGLRRTLRNDREAAA